MKPQTSTNIKELCQGHWAVLISFLAPSLKEAIDHRPYHVPCPFHGGNDGLRAFNDFDETGGMVCNTCLSFPNGIDVLMWINKWSFVQTMHAIKKALDHIAELEEGCSLGKDAVVEPQEQFDKLSIINDVVNQLHPLDSKIASPARRYLKKRGLCISCYPDNLYFHPSLPYTGKHYVEYPAIVALITNEENELVGIHRTFLTVLGDKAPGPSPKRMLSAYNRATTGAAIKLYRASTEIALAEGIETSLAVYQATKLPVWATISANGMTKVQIPQKVKMVQIWCDKDRNEVGQKAASKLASRLISEGKKVKVLVPPLPIQTGCKAIDWLDVLNCDGGGYV
jgi:putative DNA primase/helicase